ncbi:hypothetical protein LINGRAHAP2_LOCUS18549, partial [Linum grandiflorum]
PRDQPVGFSTLILNAIKASICLFKERRLVALRPVLINRTHQNRLVLNVIVVIATAVVVIVSSLSQPTESPVQSQLPLQTTNRTRLRISSRFDVVFPEHQRLLQKFLELFNNGGVVTDRQTDRESKGDGEGMTCGPVLVKWDWFGFGWYNLGCLVW